MKKLDIPDICQDCHKPRPDECKHICGSKWGREAIVLFTEQCSECLRGTDPRDCKIASGLFVAMAGECGRLRPEIARKYTPGQACPDQTRRM